MSSSTDAQRRLRSIQSTIYPPPFPSYNVKLTPHKFVTASETTPTPMTTTTTSKQQQNKGNIDIYSPQFYKMVMGQTRSSKNNNNNNAAAAAAPRRRTKNNVHSTNRILEQLE